MHKNAIRCLLESLQRGEKDVDEAMACLGSMPFEDLGFAKVDHHRALRCGFCEVIYGQNKSPSQVAAIFKRCAAGGGNVLATRVDKATCQAVAVDFPNIEHNESARTITLRQRHKETSYPGTVAIVAAGTGDIPVAEEARVTAQIMDQTTATFYDVGVAGLHRLLACREAIQSARVIIVVAGMEGALPSVVGGLVDVPVIAVPTSVGYGASFGGLAALLAMLNSCAAGVTVVNIDNGFGAGYAASVINRLQCRRSNAQ